MVWIVEKKVVYHLMDVGFERVKIPIRVKFEYEVKGGVFVSDSLSTHTLYNKKALETARSIAESVQISLEKLK